jgi:hypothetical protein
MAMPTTVPTTLPTTRPISSVRMVTSSAVGSMPFSTSSQPVTAIELGGGKKRTSMIPPRAASSHSRISTMGVATARIVFCLFRRRSYLSGSRSVTRGSMTTLTGFGVAVRDFCITFMAPTRSSIHGSLGALWSEVSTPPAGATTPLGYV